MTLLLQCVVVALIVSACVIYSTWRLLSVSARVRALGLLALLPGISRAHWFQGLRARTTAGLAGGCGSCSGSTPATSPKRTPGALRRS
jgi:hypothetical protein